MQASPPNMQQGSAHGGACGGLAALGTRQPGWCGRRAGSAAPRSLPIGDCASTSPQTSAAPAAAHAQSDQHPTGAEVRAAALKAGIAAAALQASSLDACSRHTHRAAAGLQCSLLCMPAGTQTGRASIMPHQHVALWGEEHPLARTLVPEQELALPGHSILVLHSSPHKLSPCPAALHLQAS